MKPLRIRNQQARQLWLTRQGLNTAPTGKLDVLGIIRQLGYVQLDTIQVVSRAHHHILWSRNQNYREPMLDKLLARDRAVFEHYTHDASVIPMEFLPMWRRQFRRKQHQIERSNWYKAMPDRAGREAIRSRIEREGPLSTHAFEAQLAGPKKMWTRPPHKLALDYMWYTGELATCHRDKFTKYYDLAERVFPEHLLDIQIPDHAQIDWLCRSAVDRLGFATPGEIQRFWEAVDNKEVRGWVEGNSTTLREIEVETADRSWMKTFAPENIEDTLAKLKPPTSRLRILNPFDPVVRDRNRLSRLFGFDYRVEMFVPAAQRTWGYYVFPILEGHRFVGRIEAKADRQCTTLNVLGFWPETGVPWPAGRYDKLDAELGRMARFVGLSNVHWCGS